MINKLFLGKTDNTMIQFFRYLFVGGFAFVVDFSVLYLLTEKMKFYYLVSAIFSFITGLIVNYLLSRKWVFDKNKVKNIWVEFGVFAAINLVGLGLNVLIIWFATATIGLYYLVSKIIATVIVYIWNFGARKVILFK